MAGIEVKLISNVTTVEARPCLNLQGVTQQPTPRQARDVSIHLPVDKPAGATWYIPAPSVHIVTTLTRVTKYPIDILSAW